MNINMLRDTDNDLGFYAAVCGNGSAWHGATLYKSTNGGTSYSSMISMLVQASIGYVSEVLGDFTGPNIPDETNVFTVTMRKGTLSSVSYDAFLNGTNAAVVGSEIIYFRTATLVSPGVYTISGLLRGRRGSEYAMSMHVAGERFVLLDASTMYRVPGLSSDIGRARLYKAVTSGSTLSATTSQSFINVAAGLKPYSPVQLGGGSNEDGDMILTWIRRGRIAGEWQDIVDVPLSEVSELYEVEIWNASYTTLYKTISGVTEPTLTYSATDQVTDIGAVQPIIYFRVYQLSAVINRGYGAQGTAPASTTLALPSSNTVAPIGEEQPDNPDLPEFPTTSLTTPSGITSGQTITLEAGGLYIGTLDLSGLSNVTVQVSPGLPKAIITNGLAVTGWSLFSGSIYRAAIAFEPDHVAIDNTDCDLAHYPDRSIRWLTSGGGTDATHISYALPAGATGNMTGAKISVRPHNSTIEEFTVTAYSSPSITLSGSSENTDSRQFYVEGKLWMLGESNSWAYSGGYLYVWAEDGLTLDGRTVWASVNDDGIDASSSTNCTVSGVEIFGVGNGVNAADSAGFTIRDSSILQSTLDGIYAGSSEDLTVDDCVITDSYHSAINCYFGSNGVTVKNSMIDGAGMMGMPKYGTAIFIGTGAIDGNILDNTISNISYNGIDVNRNYDTNVLRNNVTTCCMALTDGGAIYTQSNGYSVAQNLIIDSNIVTDTFGDNGYADSGDSRQGFGIYLDDHAQTVTITNNAVTNCAKNIFLHGAQHTTITGNTLRTDDSNCRNSISISESGLGVSSNNTITGNDITVTNSVVCYNIEASNFPSEANFNSNRYHIHDQSNFARTWDLVGAGVDRSYTDWKSATGQDGSSTMSGA